MLTIGPNHPLRRGYVVSPVRFVPRPGESPANPEKKVALSPEQKAFVEEAKKEHVQQLHKAFLQTQSATPVSSPGGEDGNLRTDDRNTGGKS